jgi:hypothetical protein
VVYRLIREYRIEKGQTEPCGRRASFSSARGTDSNAARIAMNGIDWMNAIDWGLILEITGTGLFALLLTIAALVQRRRGSATATVLFGLAAMMGIWTGGMAR